MTEAVSVKVGERTKRLMGIHEDINWSAVVRGAIEKRLQELDATAIDKVTAQKAARDAAELRKRYRLQRGEKPAETLVREWRERRRL